MANDPKVVETTKDWLNQAVNDKGYREGVDYSLAIRNETDPGMLQQLKDERAAKIKYVYGGDDPYTIPTKNEVTGQATKPTNTAAQYGYNWTPQNATVQSSAAYRDLQNQVNNVVFGAQAQQPTVRQQAPVVQQPAFDVQGIIDAQQQAATGVKDKFTSYLDQWLADAQTQAKNAADYAVNQGVAELERAEADAQVQFQNQRDQIDIDEARAKDNQALYAERRGDKGGIGAAQYDAIMATAAKNRLAVNQSQVKLSTDTARQIADLRAQGEFEKADKLLALSQQYLSQLVQLEQWALSYGLDAAQFQASLQQWQAEFEMAQSELTGFYNGAPTLGYQQYQNELALTQQNQMASAAETLLAAGIMPSESQLKALGISADQAQSYIAAVKLAAAQKGSSGSGGGGGTGMSLATAKLNAEHGIFTPEVLNAFYKNDWTDDLLAAEYGYEAPVAIPEFSTYKDAAAFLKAQGANSAGLLTQSEWVRHVNSGNDTSGASEYATYAEYLKDFVDYKINGEN